MAYGIPSDWTIKSEVGTKIEIICNDTVEFPVDFTTAVAAWFYVQKPDGTTAIWRPTVINAKTLRYYSQGAYGEQEADLFQTGEYRLMVWYDSGAFQGYIGTTCFSVYEEFEQCPN